jgi:hypothetical protein
LAGGVSSVFGGQQLPITSLPEPVHGQKDRSMSRHPQIGDEGTPSSHTDRVDVAARYLVYNLFLAVISGTRQLRDLDEKVETLARAVERGWVEVFERRRKSGDMVRLIALTDEGRRMARRNLH